MTYGPRVEWQQLMTNTRIYYTGDMANADGFGTITEARVSERWGYQQVDIKMDDGREFRGIHLSNFQPAPGRRFWMADDWQADRQRRIDEMQAEYANLMARRSA